MDCFPINSQHNVEETTPLKGTWVDIVIATGIIHLNSAYLKSVLLYHNLPTIGTKEQLVLRTYLVRPNRITDIVAREQGQLNQHCTEGILSKGDSASLLTFIEQESTCTPFNQMNDCTFIPVPSHIHTEEDINIYFKPQLDHINPEHKRREEQVCTNNTTTKQVQR